METKSEKEWNQLIKSSIQSGQRITRWCQEQGVEKSVFYNHCRKLGYIRDGGRTEKWAACSASTKEVTGKSIFPDASEEQSLVPVPKRTIGAAVREIREDDMIPVRYPESSPSPDMFPSVCIQKAAWKVFVGDGFHKETLRDVLEVIANAQGS